MSENERVGYGHPPIAYRFKPGQSGNPTGRPSDRRRFEDDLIRELDREATSSKTSETATQQELVARALIRKAKEGDLRAMEAIYRITQDPNADNVEAADREAEELSAIESYVVDEVERRLAAIKESST